MPCPQVFTFPGGELHSIATRFTLPPRCLAYSPSGIHLAASGDDEGIKLIDITGNKVFRTLRSNPYNRGLAYDPESEYLADANGSDGTLTVWSLTTGKAVVTKKRACSKVDPLSPARVTPAWHPDGGALLAVPSPEGTIEFFERLSWEPAGDLADQHSAAVQLLAFSKNGLYLASAAADQSVVIWDVTQRKAIDKKLLPGTACGLAWHPHANEIAVITDDGQLAVWKSPVPASMASPTADADALEKQTDRFASAKAKGLASGLVDDAAAESDEDGGDNSADEYDREDSFLADSQDRGGPRGPRRSRKYTAHRRGKSSRFDEVLMSSFTTADLPQPQAPIQPGSTQMDAGRRYLAYTSLGAITLRTETDHNVVDVTFHDTARIRRRVPLLSDFFGFTLGALGEQGAVYAAPASPDAPSTVVYRPFESWAPNSDWSMGLPAGEEAIGVAAGTTFVAVTTSKRLLRLCTLAGMQMAVLSMHGAPVALAAHGDELAVAWHVAAPTPSSDQCIRVSVYGVTERRLAHESMIALSPGGATLTWLGYTDEGALAVYDSDGVLRVRTPEWGGSWVPIFFAAAERKGGEHFWVFAASLVRAEVSCIVCANGPEPTVPSGAARPVVTAAPLRVPVVPHDETLAPLEGDIARLGLVLSHAEQHGAGVSEEASNELDAAAQAAVLDSDRAGLRLFTRLLQMDRQARALDVAAALQSEAGLAGSVKIANHHRFTALAELIMGISQQRKAMEEQQQCVEDADLGRAHHISSVASEVPAVGGGIFAARRANAAAEAERDEETRVGVAHEEENGPPNGQVGALKEGLKGSTLGGKRKAAAPVGNPFARKKSSTAKTKTKESNFAQ